MSRAETPTLLSLDRFAKIMGINPVHFSGAVGTAIFPAKGNCSDVWFQHSYIGSDRVAREDLARAIANAEEDIARVLGYWPAPKWIAREMHMYPRHHRPDVYNSTRNIRGDNKGLKLRWGRFIAPGRRYTKLIGVASTANGFLVWSDPDADGFNERATVTLATTLTSTSRPQIKSYFEAHTEQEWEIRNPRSVNIVAGSVIIEFDFWQLIDPAMTDTYPTGDLKALDIANAIYVDRVDVYREYTDYSQHSAEFFWEPSTPSFLCPNCGGATCAACTTHVQCGCLHVRDVSLGIGVPVPATWNPTEETFTADTWDRCEAPDQVKLWYYAGEMSDRFLAGSDLDPLANWLAESIAWLAVARLERNFCTCSGLASVVQELRAEMSRSDAGGPNWFLSDKMADNPFGTKVGEVKAWRRLSRLADTIPQVAVI